MTQESVARRVDESAAKHLSSTREILVDHRYAELLAEDLGVRLSTARTCFEGEPQKRALGVVAWAFKHAPDDAEKRAKMILAWAKKRQAGAYRPDDAERVWKRRNGQNGGREEAEREIAQAVAAYWMEHPDRLAETLKAALQNGA